MAEVSNEDLMQIPSQVEFVRSVLREANAQLAKLLVRQNKARRLVTGGAAATLFRRRRY